jgi:hypothetical protein
MIQGHRRAPTKPTLTRKVETIITTFTSRSNHWHWPDLNTDQSRLLALCEGFRSIVNQKISYGCEQESQDLI